jgi:hypothetical protein
MSLIEEIHDSYNYDFGKLLNIVEFDNLGEYVNIHDKSDYNLLLWMYRIKYNETIIIQYIDKYYKLFDYDKLYYDRDGAFRLFGRLIAGLRVKYTIKLAQKINCIQEVIKINRRNNYNLFDYFSYLNKYLCMLLNSTGILNKPFRKICNGIIHNFELYYYNSYDTFNKNIQIIINYFGILNKQSFVTTSCRLYILEFSGTNIINKFILIYGKY